MTHFTSGKLFVLLDQLNDDFGKGRKVGDLLRGNVLDLGETLSAVKTESKDKVIGDVLAVLAALELLEFL